MKIIRLASLSLAVVCVSANAATHRWVSPHGDFSFGSSWSTGQAPPTWSPNDDVVFDSGSRSAIGGLDQSNVVVRHILVTDGYTGDVGQSGNPLRIRARQVTHRGRGRLVLDVPESTMLTSVVIDSPNNAEAANLSGHYYFLAVKNGRTVVTARGTIHTLFATSGASPPWFVYTDLQGSETASPHEMFVGSNVINYRSLSADTTIHLGANGFLRQLGSIQDGATIYQGGGTFYYDSPVDNGTVRFTLISSYGTVDFSHSYQTIEANGFVGQTEFYGTVTQQTPKSMGLLDFYPDIPDLLSIPQGDVDGDGVPDVLDKCDSTPPGAPVSASGTILSDLNGDCVVDLLDVAIMQNEFTGP